MVYFEMIIMMKLPEVKRKQIIRRSLTYLSLNLSVCVCSVKLMNYLIKLDEPEKMFSHDK